MFDITPGGHSVCYYRPVPQVSNHYKMGVSRLLYHGAASFGGHAVANNGAGSALLLCHCIVAYLDDGMNNSAWDLAYVLFHCDWLDGKQKQLHSALLNFIVERCIPVSFKLARISSSYQNLLLNMTLYRWSWNRVEYDNAGTGLCALWDQMYLRIKMSWRI